MNNLEKIAEQFVKLVFEKKFNEAEELVAKIDKNELRETIQKMWVSEYRNE